MSPNRDGFRGENDPAGAVSPYVNQRGVQSNSAKHGEQATATTPSAPSVPTVYLADPDITLYHGDALETLRTLPDESVHCVVTSPPYWGLRDYGTGAWAGGDPDCDHVRRDMRAAGMDGSTQNSQREGRTPPDDIRFRDVCGKCGAHRTDNQLGLEPTPELYVQNMVAVFREVRRVLRRDGTCWLNMGDCYNSRLDGSHGGWNGGAPEPRIVDHRGPTNKWQGTIKGLGQKQLLGMPWRLAFALQQDGWWLRADIIWAKPNPMPESVTDRPTKAHEYVFLLTRQPRYYFDQEAVREPHTTWVNDKGVMRHTSGGNRLEGRGTQHANTDGPFTVAGAHPAGRNVRSVWEIAEEEQPTLDPSLPPAEPPRRSVGVKEHDGRAGDHSGDRKQTRRVYDEQKGPNVRSVWNIATEPFPQAHFATFPTELARRCILAGTSERGCCPECGAPWERETETWHQPVKYPGGVETPVGEPVAAHAREPKAAAPEFAHSPQAQKYGRARRVDKTVGWCPTCDCLPADFAESNLKPCTVLDPFAGACTVPHVARKHGRHSIGIELSETYLRDIALPRLQQLSLLA